MKIVLFTLLVGLSGAMMAGAQTPPAVTTAPVNKTTAAGTAVTFSVAATGGALSYQWDVNDSVIANATNSSLTLSSPALSQNGYFYSVSVSNTAGSTNVGAYLTVTDTVKPTVTFANLTANQTVGTQFTVTGTASDNSGVIGVWYSLNSGPWTAATTANGWTNWSAALTLPTGANTLRVYAQDVAGHGYVYVADTLNNLIRKITPAGTVSTLAGNTNTLAAGYKDGAGAQALFNSPGSVTVDLSGNIYVADQGNNLIRKITPSGTVSTLAGDTSGLTAGFADGAGGSALFADPAGVAVDGSGNVYVADLRNCIIRKISAAGGVTTYAGNTNGLTSNINDSSPSGGYLDGPAATAEFYNPAGVAVDGSGNVYVADYGNNLVRKITPDGMVTTLAGDTNDAVNLLPNNGYADGTGGDAKFNGPVGISVDGAGNVYVADEYNDLIREITPGGVVTTLAGNTNGLLNSSGNFGFADGLSDQALFEYPEDIAIDVSGMGYVADTGNDAIRQVAPNGWVTSLCGGTNGLSYGNGYVDGPLAFAVFNQPEAVAVDDSGGNLSATNSVSFTAGNYSSLLIQATGKGTISPNYSNAVLQVGTSYSVTAAATSGCKFSNWVISTNWVGTLSSNLATLHFVMQPNLTLQVNFADTNNPVLAITNTAGPTHYTNTTVKVQGTATDNVAVASIFWRLGATGAWNMIPGTNAWTVLVNPPMAGSNFFFAYAMDTSGNLSTTNQRIIIYTGGFTPLTVTSSGQGAITPNYNGQPLGVGETYSMTATGANGFGLVNWTGGTSLPLATVTNGATVTFVMKTNLTLQANFTDVEAPTLAITSPLPVGPQANLATTMSGTANDNDQVVAVMYQLNGGAWQPASGTTAWTASLNLSLGTNVFSAYSVDAAGNVSVTNTVGTSVSLLQPVIDSITCVSNTVTVSFSSLLGVNYSLQYESPLGTGWVDLAGTAPGTGGELSLSDTNPPAAGRFYRLEAQTP